MNSLILAALLAAGPPAGPHTQTCIMRPEYVGGVAYGYPPGHDFSGPVYGDMMPAFAPTPVFRLHDYFPLPGRPRADLMRSVAAGGIAPTFLYLLVS